MTPVPVENRVPVETMDPRLGGMGGHFQAPHDG